MYVERAPGLQQVSCSPLWRKRICISAALTLSIVMGHSPAHADAQGSDYTYAGAGSQYAA